MPMLDRWLRSVPDRLNTLQSQMRRREFIAGFGASAAWAIAARAQQLPVPMIGYLDTGSREARRDLAAAFHRGLLDRGYVEGRNLTVEHRWAYSRYDQLPALAADLVRRQAAVIVAVASAASVLAVKAASNSIPIVFVTGTDPVEAGLVASLNRPGGNVTGVSLLLIAVVAKRLQLLHEMVPRAKLIGYLANGTDPVGAEHQTKELQVEAVRRGVRLLIRKVSDPSEFETAFMTLVREGAEGLIIGADSLFGDRSEELAALATRYRIPAIYPRFEGAWTGGLMSYGTNFLEAYREAGVYAGRILQGEKPADLPVQLVRRVELIINLKAARALGIAVPRLLLARADEVVE